MERFCLQARYTKSILHFQRRYNPNLSSWTAPTTSDPPRTYLVHYSRASSCPGNGSASENDHNTPLQVGAVFIILFVSGLACSFPTLAKQFPGLRLSPRFFFAVRHFGTGVLIATAFVHLLPTAFISLGNACLPSFWTEDYPAMPGAIALAGIFLVVVIEMVFHPCRRVQPLALQDRSSHATQREPMGNRAPNSSNQEASAGSISMPTVRPIGGRVSSIGRTMSANRSITEVDDNPDQRHQVKESYTMPEVEIRNMAKSTLPLADEQKLRKDRLQCILLEVGILFHSVFIGMALSVSTGSDFVVLLIAITFHRKFNFLDQPGEANSHLITQRLLKAWR